jgi:hypothetical protein
MAWRNPFQSFDAKHDVKAIFRCGLPFEQIDEQSNQKADDDHGRDRYEQLEPLGLDANVSGQLTEPVQEPGRKMEYGPDGSDDDSCDDQPASHRLPDV